MSDHGPDGSSFTYGVTKENELVGVALDDLLELWQGRAAPAIFALPRSRDSQWAGRKGSLTPEALSMAILITFDRQVDGVQLIDCLASAESPEAPTRDPVGEVTYCILAVTQEKSLMLLDGFPKKAAARGLDLATGKERILGRAHIANLYALGSRPSARIVASQLLEPGPSLERSHP